MATFGISIPSIVADLSTGSLSIRSVDMDDADDVDILDSPPEPASPHASEQSAYEKQSANLAAYLDALPYKCESIQEMQEKLEHIIARLVVCAESKNWAALTNWDALLQWYVQPLILSPAPSLGPVGCRCTTPSQRLLAPSWLHFITNYVSFPVWTSVSSEVGPL